ncbi:hypothetical protein [Xenorhabdus sp. SGI240]|uniref:hypothetical protein n=1 Tax=Xenorhabdus sp. SGI240 TaxID=3158262 RepID=UPI0032B801FF
MKSIGSGNAIPLEMELDELLGHSQQETCRTSRSLGSGKPRPIEREQSPFYL